jgi:hypothetical protein
VNRAVWKLRFVDPSGSGLFSRRNDHRKNAMATALNEYRCRSEDFQPSEKIVNFFVLEKAEEPAMPLEHELGSFEAMICRTWMLHITWPDGCCATKTMHRMLSKTPICVLLILSMVSTDPTAVPGC